MKDVAATIRKHFDGIVAWARSRQTSGFIEALNGAFQAAKRKATRLHPLPNHENSPLPHRRNTELLANQPPRGLTHPKFKRARLSFS
jgi:Transposase